MSEVQSDPAIVTNFFAVSVNEKPLGSFLSVSGLSFEITYDTYEEGGRNSGPLFFPTGAASQRLILEKGFVSADFFNEWMKSAATGAFKPVSVAVQLLSPRGTPLREWFADRAWVASVEGPDLHAMRGDVAVLRAELMHTGMLMRPVTGSA